MSASAPLSSNVKQVVPFFRIFDMERSLRFYIDGLGFAILVRDGAELMLQSIESVRKDAPQFAPQSRSHDVGLFIEVEDFADILKRLDGYPTALPERTTFYGMREIGVHEPSGHIVIFAARP